MPVPGAEQRNTGDTTGWVNNTIFNELKNSVAVLVAEFYLTGITTGTGKTAACCSQKNHFKLTAFKPFVKLNFI